MTRSQFLLPLVCLLIMGGVALFLKRNPVVPKEPAVPGPLVANNQPSIEQKPHPVAKQPPAEIHFDPLPAASPIVDVVRPDAPPLPELVGESTAPATASWENPFAPGLWRSSGWKYSPRGMETLGTESSSATFVRPYRKLMLECDILGTGANDASWELRLTTQNAATMSFVIRSDRISVMARENGASRVVLEKPLTTQLLRGVPRPFRIVATGNRIVVSWDRRRLLTTEQIAAQSGHDIVWSIHTEGAAFHIPRMRVEGD